MALIPTVGRRTLKSRLFLLMVYLLLSAGAVTMVYPFMLMLGTSLTSEADYVEFRPVPRYLTDLSALFAKEVEIRYSGDMTVVNQLYGTDWANLQAVTPPVVLPDNQAVTAAALIWNSAANYFEGQIRGMSPVGFRYVNPKDRQVQEWINDYREFKKALPLTHISPAYAGWIGGASNAPSRLLELYRSHLKVKFKTISSLNRAYMDESSSFSTVLPPSERMTRREWNPEKSAKLNDWVQFKANLPERFRQPVSMDGIYQTWLSQIKYEDSIEKLNAAWKSSFDTFNQITLEESAPIQPQRKADWAEFVRTQLPLQYLIIDTNVLPAWRQFLKGRYKTPETLNTRHGKNYASFNDVRLASIYTAEGQERVDWMEFTAKAAPLSALHPDTADNRYRNHLRQKFASVEAVNKAFGTKFASFSEIRPPFALDDWDYVIKNEGALKKYFLTSNYRLVWDYIGRHGRGITNTFIYVMLAIVTHLLVNPLCAYALSRYNLKYAHRVLLFLLATMAFPAEVAMIPSFLLLKQLNLLNTFAALILPTIASGYSIFLLKGFFDSLPKELYEAGIIDGASEGRMFWQITVPLSKPVLAVIALSSFTAAYGNFMFAFLVCQDPKMWTLMVWLYQLQINSPSYVVMAALTLAAIPTLAVFVFCQNIIMRGIILPSFK